MAQEQCLEEQDQKALSDFRQGLFPDPNGSQYYQNMYNKYQELQGTIDARNGVPPPGNANQYYMTSYNSYNEQNKPPS